MENGKKVGDDLLEAQILYSVIFTPEWMHELNLVEEDFIHYQSVYKAIKKITDEGKTIEYASVLALSNLTKEMCLYVLSNENFGTTIIPFKKMFEEKTEILKEISAKRQINQDLVNDFDLDLLKAKLEQIYKKGSHRWLTGDDIQVLAQKILQEKEQASITYGLSLLDKVTKGIEKGQYIIVAGRPSIGKSSFLQFCGLRNADKGKKVLFVSVEMPEEMIIKRILKTYGPTSIPKTFNILIASDTGTIEAEIQSKARDFDLILVDYIQLLKPKVRTRDMYERVTNISGELKSMATKFNLPFMCASQFSRKAEGNQPSLADLKESGALEQDADVVISLWKDRNAEELSTEVDDALLKIKIDLLKNRNGWVFTNNSNKNYEIMFKRNEFRFYDVISFKEP